MKLVIEGKEATLKQIAKELKIRAKRKDLKLSFQDAKQIKVKDAETVKPKNKAKTSKSK